MSGVATAVAGSAVISAYASNKAAKSQSKAAGKAADSQVAMNRQNIQLQREMFNQQRQDNKPWREVGAKSIRQLRTAIDKGMFNPSNLNQGKRFQFSEQYDPGRADRRVNVDIEEDPSYQFRKQEGINALDASAAARGRLQSGAQDRAVTRYGSDLASQEYQRAYARQASERDAAFNRYQQGFSTRYGMATDDYNRSRDRNLTQIDLERRTKGDSYNRLASLANVGQVANQSTQQARSQMASSIGQSTRASGNALAQGALQQGQASAQGYQGMAGAANQGIQNYLMYSMMGG